MVTLALAFGAAYLLIGLLFEVFGPSGRFDVRTLIFWPFGIDIHVKYWTDIWRIRRDGSRRLTEAIAGRDSSLSLVHLQWTGYRDEALITMNYGGEISCWRGSCTVWHRDPDGSRASTWLESWLCDRWTAARALRRGESQSAGVER